jgi:alpha-1,3-rhamnosyl/mannosyltransferase
MLKGFSQLTHKPRLTLFCGKADLVKAGKLKNSLAPYAEIAASSFKIRHLENIYNFINYPKLQNFTGSFDIYHCFHHFMPPTAKQPKVLTIHDLRRYKLPEMYVNSKLKRFETAVKRADHYIAISESTRSDFCEIFSIDPKKVSVVHLAVDMDNCQISPQYVQTETRKILNIPSAEPIYPFLVVMSSPDKRKNIKRTIEAFLNAADKIDPDIKLVITGNLPFNDAQLKALLKQDSQSKVVVTGPVENLNSILAAAKGMIFASLYEGFGLPILEAFALQTPVITSDCSSMPEIAGPAALLVNPDDTDSITEAIIKLTTDNRIAQHLINTGLIRLNDFSWKKTAQQLMKIYSTLV